MTAIFSDNEKLLSKISKDIFGDEIRNHLVWIHMQKQVLGSKIMFLDPNSDVENETCFTHFLWQFWAKNTKINFSSESVKTKEHKESNSCNKYLFSINAFYKINLWPILKKLLQKIDFHHFPLFEIIAQLYVWSVHCMKA